MIYFSGGFARDSPCWSKHRTSCAKEENEFKKCYKNSFFRLKTFCARLAFCQVIKLPGKQIGEMIVWQVKSCLKTGCLFAQTAELFYSGCGSFWEKSFCHNSEHLIHLHLHLQGQRWQTICLSHLSVITYANLMKYGIIALNPSQSPLWHSSELRSGSQHLPCSCCYVTWITLFQADSNMRWETQLKDSLGQSDE